MRLRNRALAAFACATGLLAPGFAAAPVPGGFYTLSNGQPPQPPAAAVMKLPFVDGFSLRINWSIAEPSAGNYDFSAIDAALAVLQTHGKKMTVTVTPLNESSYLTAAPGVQTYQVTHGGVSYTVPVPWDENQLTRWEALMQALATHQVPSGAPGSPMIAFRDHPLFANIAAEIPGMNGIRDDGGTLIAAPGYDRAVFTAAVVRAVKAAVTQFPKQVPFVEIFTIEDRTTTPSLNQVLLAALQQNFFNASGLPQIAFFEENLACSTPVPTFAFALFQEQNNLPIMFQMLQGWVTPFQDAPKTGVCLVTSTPGDITTATSGPEVGIQFAYQTYGARYFEIYQADLQHTQFANAFQAWHDLLTEASGSAGQFYGSLAPNYGGAVAPGALASAFLSTGASGQAVAAQLPLPTSLENATLVAGGSLTLSGSQLTYSGTGAKAVPLLYAGPNQINFQVPNEFTAGALIPLQLQRPDGTTLVGHMRIQGSTPGIFTMDGSGHGQGAVLNQDGTLNSAVGSKLGGKPASPGDVIQIFATGSGLFSPTVPDGQEPSGLSNSVAQPTVTIGGETATVTFSGAAPGFAGVWQINAKVPTDLQPSSAVSLFVTAAAMDGNMTTIAVQ
jgi:uncharacterized protein (TIGR03437 family)